MINALRADNDEEEEEDVEDDQDNWDEGAYDIKYIDDEKSMNFGSTTNRRRLRSGETHVESRKLPRLCLDDALIMVSEFLSEFLSEF